MESLPRVLERVTGNFEDHDVLLHHVLHEDVLAVRSEGDPLRPVADRGLGQLGELLVVQASEDQFAVIRKERGVFGLVTPVHDDHRAELAVRRQHDAFWGLPDRHRLDHARRLRRPIDEASGPRMRKAVDRGRKIARSVVDDPPLPIVYPPSPALLRVDAPIDPR